ncbi:MAG: type I methionyl aminopeptidase, partial [Saprospiraceae bacterium]|nr:type I methionyl aminopeptidase [Candidatus Brachybacter algidus]
PPDVPNFGKRGNGLRLEEGWTIAIEPMVNLGSKDVYQAMMIDYIDRGWKPSAHYEHTVVGGMQGGEILTDLYAN